MVADDTTGPTALDGKEDREGMGKRFSRDAIYAQTVANNTSRLIRNVCQMKAQQRSRERRNRGEDPKYLSLITGWYVSVFLLGFRNLSRRLGSRSFVFELCTIGTMGYRVSRHRTRNDPFLPSSPNVLLLVDYESLEAKRFFFSFIFRNSFLIIRPSNGTGIARAD